jgi:N-acetylneuraminic acid mutarotase
MGISRLLGVSTESNINLFGSLSIVKIKKLFTNNFFDRLSYRTVEKIYSYGGASADPSWIKDTDEYYNDTWSARTDIPSPGRRTAACTVYNKGYVFSGEADPPGEEDYILINDTDEYSPNDFWTSKTAIPSPARKSHSALTISSKGYVWAGYDDNDYIRDNDKFDPRGGENTWTSITELPSPAREDSAVTPISGKGYIFGGSHSSVIGDTDEYNPIGSSWTAKSTIPDPTVRECMAAFTLSSTGYLCGGGNGVNSPYTFHELDAYDPVEDNWTLKADMTYYRENHAAISKDSLGYEFGGAEEGEGAYQQSVNAYSPGEDSWEAKAAMPAPARARHSASVITYEVQATTSSGTPVAETDIRLYSFAGNATGGMMSDNDEYNPDTWTGKTSLPSMARDKLCASDIDWKGYAFSGETMMGRTKDNDEYDSNEDVWSGKTDLPSPGRVYATAVTVNNKCYVFGGQGAVGEVGDMLRDTDEYDPDSWTEKTDMPSPARHQLRSAVLSDKAYVFGGSISGTTYLKDTDEYDPDSWTSKTDMPSPEREQTFVSAISDKIYVFGGLEAGPGFIADTDEYDPDSWASKTNVPSPARAAGDAGQVSSKGYLCGGDDTTSDLDGWLQDTDEYDSSEDSWAAKTNMPSPARKWNSLATIDIATYTGTEVTEKVYIFGGIYDSEGDTFMKDTEEYDGSSWTSKTDMPSPARGYLAGSNISDKAYIYGGETSGDTFLQDTEEYDPDSWTSKDNMPSPARNRLSASTISDKGYVYGGSILDGENESPLQDTDEYDPAAGESTWTSKDNMPSPARRNHTAITISSKGYVFGGYDSGSSYVSDVDEYDPAAGESNWTTMDALSSARDLLAASVIGSYGYVYGGRKYDGEFDVPIKDTDKFDPEAGESNWTSDTDMPSPARYAHTASTIDSHGLVAAGYNDVSYLQDCDYFDPSGGEAAWSNLDNIPSPARYGVPASCTLEV